MKRYIAFAGLAFMLLQGTTAQTIVKPSVKSKTTFAIVTDEKSYEQAKNEIDAYRTSVEQEGLGTYLLIDDWKSPQPIRELLIKLHADKKAPLEGCAFVGDIPVPMVRDAQHLCSAFKRKQSDAWHKSSVPSDRYYDDFGLKFDYLKQDSVNTDYHYVSLRADGNQYLSPDIYSGRIRPTRAEGMDKYQLLRDYLKKVVAEKQSNNKLDQLTMARGHGYNSEDMLAWSGEQLALREQLPQLFLPGNLVKFYDFNFQFPAKFIYLNEVQRDDLDIMLFHHHGNPDAQYINGYQLPVNVQACIESIKIYVRSKVPARAEKVGREQAAQHPRKLVRRVFRHQQAETGFHLSLPHGHPHGRNARVASECTFRDVRCLLQRFLPSGQLYGRFLYLQPRQDHSHFGLLGELHPGQMAERIPRLDGRRYAHRSVHPLDLLPRKPPHR